MSSSTANFPRPPGIRDIPIQRSASAFAPMFGGSVAGGATAPLHSSRPPTTAPSEYYRREVLTRTLVTRSSETLSAAPPLGRSSPAAPLLTLEQPPPPRDEMPEEYWLRYSRNIEEEERRVREAQDRRKRDEEERRKRVEEQRRRWEQQELEQLERLRRERERMEQALEAQTLDRERVERERIGHDRAEREAAEKRRREEWERIEREHRQYEEAELEKRRNLERLERERLERERLEAERLERERLEALRREQERLEQQRLEQERLELERLEFERLEIERIERIKRDQREKEERDRERAKQEAERLAREREELERLERERIELERQAKELMEKERREEEERERERREEALREALRREEELREREALERAEREAQEREMARRARERAEQERLEALRREQERLEQEQLEAERRERERQEEERRERELLEASLRAKERRDFERLEEEERERQRQEEERRERERRDRERLEAVERERQRQSEEQRERDRLAALEASAVERRALRAREGQRARERAELDRRAEELRDLERRERERRDRERAEEERRLAELRDAELRNAGQREMERREAQEREERRRQDGWRSRERLEQLARERDERERWEAEKRRLLSDYEQEARKRQALTSKETLERLTRKPYYSRENLSQLGTGEPTELRGRGAEPSEITTKVERQVIERVDRTLWTEPETLRASVGLPPPPVTSAYFGNTCGILPSLLDASEESVRERIYNPRDEDFLRRGGSQRTSKYRARMEKARKEFLQGTPGTEHLPPSADPVSERFRKSTEELQQRRVEYRGPLLQRFNSGEFAHAPLEPPPTHYAPGFGRSPYEQTPSEPSLLTETRTVTREYSREAYSKTEVSTVPYPDGRQQPGYTVSTVPTEWGTVQHRKHSRVVEVADTFIDRQLPGAAPLAHRYGGRITLEEALDAIFQSTQPVEEPPPADPGMPEQQLHLRNMDGPGIFTPDQALMDRLAEQPHLAESLLKNEPMFVRCAFCAYVRPLRDARFHFCWCRHCYTYYCSRQCRLRDWHRHRDRCSFARINSLCKEVIMKVRRDPETQYHMSRVAREGFRREGRGSVNIRLISAYSAQLYLEQGWRVFAQHDPNQLLFYYPIQALIEQRKELSLIQLCKKYNPNEKFILSVSIIADIEQCPQTPPPAEPTSGTVGSATSNNTFPTVYGTAAVPTNV
uniref:LIM zinc-binding domain-containing protein n=1 Tax=Globodera pallida TaxID=36090 RepID=A0A183BYF9_GLOPA